MDLVAEVDRKAVSDSKAVEPPRPVFVMPRISELPNDGLLSYHVVTSVFDLRDVVAGSVVSCGDANILSLINDFPSVFDLAPKVLAGVPNCDYNATFTSCVWRMEEVSYQSLIGELSLQIERQQALDAASKTVNANERDRFKRADGTVKTVEAEIVDDGTEVSDDPAAA